MHYKDNTTKKLYLYIKLEERENHFSCVRKMDMNESEFY